ncbi:hypothetical protein GGQ99_004821 [Aminobacter niigataensis]|uniref:Uncharacterized protein n=1 Tax=Aminobacter niigataensis TaxID=83265 RepID=A0ABR6L8A3_9HYPH|nr:hypothetical protein [Aminobacter niigataensis]MBB4653037.1 hypothetical protein [Aminobacter niigataensis]
MSPVLFSIAAIAISAFAIWHRSVIGWIVAACANIAAMWLMWPTL